ncbi:MAG: hypothetical protein AAFQ99_05490, partial [Pseudomonadota bacterium]
RMAVNLRNLSVISGNRNSSARELRIHGTEDRELTQQLVQVLRQLTVFRSVDTQFSCGRVSIP